VKTNNSLTLTVILIFLTQLVVGQTIKEKELQGKVTVNSVLIEGVNITNTSNQKTTVSDKGGMFQLVVKEGDVLVFSAVNLEILRKKINKQDLILDLILVQMTLKSDELKEVIVTQHPEINAVSLGISPQGMKHYTAAERKIYTANSGGGIDGLLNKISGRTAMLKKELVVEKKEGLLLKIELLFENKYYIETLKIPADYIKGFQYYCIEDSSLAAAIQSKNKTMILFLIVPLAEKFNKIIQNEN
jgi:hypothetical protein